MLKILINLFYFLVDLKGAEVLKHASISIVLFIIIIEAEDLLYKGI